MRDVISVLNRLLQLHSRSLVVYLGECAPWTAPDDTGRVAAIREIASSERDTVDQIAELILSLNGVPDLGDFPLNFTRFNDLSIDYLLKELTRRQRTDVQSIAECVERLQGAPAEALAIAEEAHGAALGYLDRFVELAKPASHAS